MGHNRLGHLPRNQRWKQVIALLDQGADLSSLANASFRAALVGLRRVPNDQGFLNVLNAVVDLANVSRQKDLSSALQSVGISPNECDSSFGFVSAISKLTTERLGQTFPRSDVGKIAQDALVSSLTDHMAGKSGSLFGGMEDARSVTSPFRGAEFKGLMHEFYGRFTSRYLSYYLSRELPHHVGAGKHFANLDDHTQFADSFDLYCRQTVRIADEFTPGWVGKAVYEGKTGREAVSKYAHVAFDKLTSEFEKGGS